MIEKIIIFIVFLTPLIFFHELGHFLFARLFGVRVEVFSIGFGPKIFKLKRNQTEYAISAIPLGGYVKMFGDDPLDPDKVPPEERHLSFVHKGKWARFWIVFGGPLANFILAYWILFGLLLSGEKVPEAQFGYISKDSTFYSYGIRTGDKIKSLNGEEVLGLTDLSMRASDGLIRSVGIERDEKSLKIKLDLTAKKFFDSFLAVTPRLRMPVVVNGKGESFALSHNESSINWDISLDHFSDVNSKKSYFLHPLKSTGNEEKPFELDPSGKPIKLALSTSKAGNFFGFLRKKGFYANDLVVSSVLLDAPAEKAGMRKGDLILSLNDKVLYGFEDLREKLQSIKPEIPVEISILRENKKQIIELVPVVSYQNEKAVKTIGIYSAGQFLPIKYINSRPKGVGESLMLAVSKTWKSMVQTVVSYKQLITMKVPLSNIGGPIAIGKVASESFNISISYFFKLMALISVNLGIINLFPIPVLDGGHIMFIGLEIFNRGPLSRRKMEIAQQFGVSLLFFLIFAALFNDISKLF